MGHSRVELGEPDAVMFSGGVVYYGCGCGWRQRWHRGEATRIVACPDHRGDVAIEG